MRQLQVRIYSRLEKLKEVKHSKPENAFTGEWNDLEKEQFVDCKSFKNTLLLTFCFELGLSILGKSWTHHH